MGVFNSKNQKISSICNTILKNYEVLFDTSILHNLDFDLQEIKKSQNFVYEKIIFNAIYQNDEVLINELLKNPSWINEKSIVYPLKIAIKNTNEDIVKKLIEAGADLTIPLDESFYNTFIGCALLEHSMLESTYLSTGKYTPLYKKSKYKNYDIDLSAKIVLMLIDNYPPEKREDLENEFFYCCEYNYPTFAKKLFMPKFATYDRIIRGNSIMEYLKDRKYNEIIKILEQK